MLPLPKKNGFGSLVIEFEKHHHMTAVADSPIKIFLYCFDIL
jgi:hypothetical protein